MRPDCHNSTYKYVNFRRTISVKLSDSVKMRHIIKILNGVSNTFYGPPCSAVKPVRYNIIGVLVAAKQRQEFRISLQKRARHRAEKRAEWLETEINWREVGCEKSLLLLLLLLACCDKPSRHEDIRKRDENNELQQASW